MDDLKSKLGIAKDKKILLSAGELIKRKNHETIIQAVKEMHDNTIVYVICGHGELEGYLKKLVKELEIEEQVYFLGYRNDIAEIYQVADLFVFPSYQEGLPFALLEAMESKKAAVFSKIRVNTDLIDDEDVLVEPTDMRGFCKAISKVLSDNDYRKYLEKKNYETAQKFDKQNVTAIIRQIYRELD